MMETWEIQTREPSEWCIYREAAGLTELLPESLQHSPLRQTRGNLIEDAFEVIQLQEATTCREHRNSEQVLTRLIL